MSQSDGESPSTPFRSLEFPYFFPGKCIRAVSTGVEYRDYLGSIWRRSRSLNVVTTDMPPQHWMWSL